MSNISESVVPEENENLNQGMELSRTEQSASAITALESSATRDNKVLSSANTCTEEDNNIHPKGSGSEHNTQETAVYSVRPEMTGKEDHLNSGENDLNIGQDKNPLESSDLDMAAINTPLTQKKSGTEKNITLSINDKSEAGTLRSGASNAQSPSGNSKSRSGKTKSKFAGASADDIVIVGGKSSLYSTAYVLRKITLNTENAIRFFRKSTFARINNCLFNLCLILPIHLSDEDYREVYTNLNELFSRTELQLKDGLEKISELLRRNHLSADQVHYTAPINMELKLRTPLSQRYLDMLLTLDRLISAIDEAMNAGIIQNPKDAVRLKHRWEQALYQFSGEIRSLDIATDRKVKSLMKKVQDSEQSDKTKPLNNP